MFRYLAASFRLKREGDEVRKEWKRLGRVEERCVISILQICSMQKSEMW